MWTLISQTKLLKQFSQHACTKIFEKKMVQFRFARTLLIEKLRKEIICRFWLSLNPASEPKKT